MLADTERTTFLSQQERFGASGEWAHLTDAGRAGAFNRPTNGGIMNQTGPLLATALLLSACTPSLNLQVALPEIRPPGFDVALAASETLGPAPLTAVFTAEARESASYA